MTLAWLQATVPPWSPSPDRPGPARSRIGDDIGPHDILVALQLPAGLGEQRQKNEDISSFTAVLIAGPLVSASRA